MIDLDKLMLLYAGATPGPWEVKSGEFEGYEGYGTVTAPYVEADGKMICVPFDRDPEDENDESDAAYIVAACNAVPELVARIREVDGGRRMTEKKKHLLAGKLAFLCNHASRDGTCPMMIDCDCPFWGWKRMCSGIRIDDWKKWLDSEKMNFEREEEV